MTNISPNIIYSVIVNMSFNRVYKECPMPRKMFNVANKVYVDEKDFIADLKWSARDNDHVGWVKCDGRALSRADYNELFEVIGTTYGVGDNSTTFNIPDCRGRVLGGTGSGTGLTARSKGAVVGSETHTLTTNEMPSHTHTSNAVGGTVGLVTSNGANTAMDGLDSTAGEPNLYAAPTALTINSAGSGAAHNNMQPTIFIGSVFIYAGESND